MKPTDFSMHLTSFLSDYLPIQKNVSRNTIRSYRDTFKLLLLFCEKEEAVPIEKLTMKKLSPERIERFLDWLETERKSSISTRNLRLTAIHSFFRYAQAESPEALYHYQKVLAIPVITSFRYRVTKSLFFWMNRRSQRRSYQWSGFLDMLTKAYPLAKPRIYVSIYG